MVVNSLVWKVKFRAEFFRLLKKQMLRKIGNDPGNGMTGQNYLNIARFDLNFISGCRKDRLYLYQIKSLLIMPGYPFKRMLWSVPLMFLTLTIQAQENGNPGPVYHFDGSVSVTNNGFSFIPLFSLGKPASIVNLSMGGDRFSFDPQFRFDLAGLKPWSFIFIWRYKMIQTDKFQLKVGAHLPAYSFREQPVQVDGGGTENRLVPFRVMALELLPTHKASEHITLGAYYIHGFALEEFDPTRHIDFLSLRAFFTQLHLTKQLYLNWNPEVYYLNLFGSYGFYAAHSIALGHEKIPVSLSSTMNIRLKSEIATKEFDWNLSLVYTFRNELVKK
jgi:hypothetical protein